MSDVNDMNEEGGSGGGFLNHLPAILWQRRWLVIPPLVLLSAAGVAAAALLPTTYQSTATLLVEAQELPTDLVASPTTSLLDQRIAKIRQQVLSRGDLIELIEQNGLYDEERRSKPLSEVVETMREATTVAAVTGDIGQSGGSDKTNTIAFSMSYSYRDPYKAQAIMQSFVERFLEIDTANSADQATDTLAFLQEQESGLRRQIAALEGQITTLKARNGAALAGAGMTPTSNPGSFDAQIAALQGENRQLLLAQTRRPPPVPVVRDQGVAIAEAQLAAARATYSDGHPDVALAEQRLTVARRLARDNVPVAPPPVDDTMIRGQIAANNDTIAALSQARANDAMRASSTVAVQSRTPVLLEQISQLDSRASALREQYQQTSAKLVNAQNAARMNQEQKGERLSVIDPPAVPDKPTSPESWLLVLAGIVLGGGLGVLLALAVELILKPVRGVDQLNGLGLEALAVVPTFVPDKERHRSRFRFKRARGSAVTA